MKSTTRRTAMLGALALTAAAMQAGAVRVSADPIFAAIARHRDVFARFNEARDAFDRPENICKSQPPAIEALDVAEREAAAAFAVAPITSPAGAAAALRHLLSDWDEDNRSSFLNDEELPAFFEHVARWRG
jgi:hypothetical protein